MNWILLAIAGYFLYPFVWKPSAVRLAAKLPPAREAMFRHAMRQTDPARLADMADAFKAEGFAKEADQLRARARLRAHPRETLEKYQEIIKRALSSTNVKAIEDVADAFREDGAGSVADLLDQYAAGLSTLKSVPPVVVPAHALAPVAATNPATPDVTPVASPVASQVVSTQTVPPGAPPLGATAHGDSVYVPPGVPAEVLAGLGVTPPPAPQQYDPLSGKNPFMVDPGNLPDNRPLGAPPGNNPFQSNGQPGIGLPGVMPQRII